MTQRTPLPHWLGLHADCSKRCQKQDWPRHKLECVALKAEAEANRVPAEQVVGPEAAAAEAAARGRERPRLRRTQCGLCGGRKPPFEITECCGRVVCSDRDNYVLMSYGRNSCARCAAQPACLGWGNTHLANSPPFKLGFGSICIDALAGSCFLL